MIIPELKNKNNDIKNKYLTNKLKILNSKSSPIIVSDAKSKKINALEKKSVHHSYTIDPNEHHITYYTKSKRKNITEYTTDIRSKENVSIIYMYIYIRIIQNY